MSFGGGGTTGGRALGKKTIPLAPVHLQLLCLGGRSTTGCTLPGNPRHPSKQFVAGCHDEGGSGEGECWSAIV